ncbi:MAG: glycosyltransferase family 39 protein [Bacteroidales bacterium]|nr:glycosyltransferase family 39 protein [Bacteroidales bacterium]
MKIKQNSISYYVFLILIPVLLIAGYNTNKWTNEQVISEDVRVYYAYLPAVVIYQDLSFEFMDELPDEFIKRVAYSISPEKDFRYLKMTMGLAILYLPFFLIAHLIALLTPFAANGYSAVYEAAIHFSTVFYVLAGFYFLRKILLRHFTEKVTSWTLVLLLLATNLLFYSTIRTGTSHGYNFALITGTLYFFEQWHEKPSWKNSLVIGLTGGLMVLIRPTNAIIALVFILYGIYNKRSLRWKAELFRNNATKLIFILLIAFLVLIPQVLYWKWISCEWVYYSYGDESFFFYDPEIFKGLFSFRKGWLIYTPVMALGIVGMIGLYRNARKYTWAIPVFFLINIYIIYSWWTWWYGGSFGSRPMIDSYGLMAIPLAVCLKFVFKQKTWINYSAQLVLILFVALNIWQSKQYQKGIIHYDGMTREAYFRCFFSWHYPKNYRELIDRPDYEAALRNIDRTESYHTQNMTPGEQKLFNLAMNSEDVKKQIYALDVYHGDNFIGFLRDVVTHKDQHPQSYNIIQKGAKERIRKQIVNNKKWYEKVKQQAAEKQMPVDSALKKQVNHTFFLKYIRKD